MSLVGRVGNRARYVAFERTVRVKPREDLVRIGSAYGGWWVPADLLGPDSVVYLAGAGEDITFDLGLVKRFGCEVISLDPTPRAIAHVRENASDVVGYQFLPVGLGGSARRERFYAPADPSHVSHSITNLQGTNDYFEAELRTLPGLMADHGHDRVDLLKIDIEGAEYEVVEHLVADSVLPRILCMEFDQPAPLPRMLALVRTLHGAGYYGAKVDRYNVTFVQRQL